MKCTNSRNVADGARGKPGDIRNVCTGRERCTGSHKVV